MIFNLIYWIQIILTFLTFFTRSYLTSEISSYYRKLNHPNFQLFSLLAVVTSGGVVPAATGVTSPVGPANPGVETTYNGNGPNGVQVSQFGNELASGYDLVIPHPKGSSSTQHVSLSHPGNVLPHSTGHGKRSALAGIPTTYIEN